MRIGLLEFPAYMMYMQDLFSLPLTPQGPRGPNRVCPSSWRLRTESWSSRGPTLADTTVSTSTVTAACPCGPRRWIWTVRTREIQSGSERRPPRWEAIAYCVLRVGRHRTYGDACKGPESCYRAKLLPSTEANIFSGSLHLSYCIDSRYFT